MDDSSKPILQDNAGLRKGRIGLPSKVQATLYVNRIEIEKKGELIAKIPFTQIDKIKFFGNVIGLHLSNGKFISLDFMSLARRATFGATGGVGIMVGAYTGRGRTVAQVWASYLRDAIG
jgi:hypothetical protein